MAFDGITIANIVKELNNTIVGGKINKIAQPEADELLLTIKNNRTQYTSFNFSQCFSSPYLLY